MFYSALEALTSVGTIAERDQWHSFNIEGVNVYFRMLNTFRDKIRVEVWKVGGNVCISKEVYVCGKDC